MGALLGALLLVSTIVFVAPMASADAPPNTPIRCLTSDPNCEGLANPLPCILRTPIGWANPLAPVGCL